MEGGMEPEVLLELIEIAITLSVLCLASEEDIK